MEISVGKNVLGLLIMETYVKILLVLAMPTIKNEMRLLHQSQRATMN